MAALLLKPVSKDLHRWLKQEAQRNRRSMTQQAMLILEQARLRPVPPVPPPARIKPLKPFTQGWLRKAIEEGRE